MGLKALRFHSRTKWRWIPSWVGGVIPPPTPHIAKAKDSCYIRAEPLRTTMEVFVCRYGVEERILYIKTNIVCITIFKETPFQVGALRVLVGVLLVLCSG